MADSIHRTDTIDGRGYPLCFKTHAGTSRPNVLRCGDVQDLYVTQARAMGGHQKEAVVTEGVQGSSWRMVSDEGPALKGTDLAPFPLGYMSAALQADLLQRITQLAHGQGIEWQGLSCGLENDYRFEGSFFKGTGVGHAYPHACRCSCKVRPLHSGCSSWCDRLWRLHRCGRLGPRPCTTLLPCMPMVAG